MPRYPYVTNCKAYEDHYSSQVGHGLPVFLGGRTQRGRGLGSLLGGIGRSLMPLVGKTLLREGAKTGLAVIGDVLAGQNVKSALSQRAKQTGKRLLQQAVGRVTAAPPGQPARKRIKSSATARQRQKRRRRNKTDIFG